MLKIRTILFNQISAEVAKWSKPYGLLYRFKTFYNKPNCKDENFTMPVGLINIFCVAIHNNICIESFKWKFNSTLDCKFSKEII